MRTISQRTHLLRLAVYILSHRERLGIGLRNRCYAGIAIAEARQRQTTVKNYYGMPLKELKFKIKVNNRATPTWRNLVMSYHAMKSAMA